MVVGEDLPVIDIDDARATAFGAIVVLDANSNEGWLLDRASPGPRRFAATGGGPGGAARMAAIVSVDTSIVAWDAGRMVFNVFDRNGTYLRTLAQPDDGDVDAFRRRVDRDFEDLRLRLRSAGGRLWLQLDDDEFDGPLPDSGEPIEVERRTHLLAIDFVSGDADTLASFESQPRTVVRGYPSHGPPPFSGRAAWAADARLIAFGFTDSARVVVQDDSGRHVAIVRWSGQDVPAKAAHRLMYVRAAMREQLSSQPASVRALWDDPARVSDAAAQLETAGVLPRFGGLEVLGDCVWVGAYDLEDNTTGIGRRWTWINVDNARFGAVEIDSIPVTPLHFGHDAILARTYRRDGTSVITRYSLPVDLRRACGIDGE